MATAYAAPISTSVDAPVARRAVSDQIQPCRRHAGGNRLRLTRRARLLVLLAVAAAVVILGPWRAIASAPAGAAPEGWSTVTVHAGDTLWTLAQRIDPTGDPRVVVSEIKQANSLATSAITPGQVLSVPPVR